MTQQASHSRTSRDDLAPSPSGSGSSAESTEIYPYSIGDKEIVLSNGTIAVPEDDLVGANPNINVVESSGVRIGHDTVFNGDVTLIQHVYAQGDRGTVGHTAEFKKEVRVVPPASKARGRRCKAVTVALMVGTFVGTAVLVALQVRAAGKTDEILPSSPTTIITTPTTTTTDRPGNILDIYFFNRTQWGGRPPVARLDLDEPVPLVIVKHTGGDSCDDPYACFGFMQTLQSEDVAGGEPDLRYNFVVGGDGNVYVGRGWGVRNAQMNDTIDIAYTGNYSVATPTQKMITAGKEIVIKGVLWGNLDLNVRVVCDNQTEATDSPGENLYREVVKWTPWYSGEIVDGTRAPPHA